VSAGEPALWPQLADEDLAMARLAFDQGIYRQTCFHAQQAVEKALKALLLARQGTYPKTHSLEDLLAFDTSGELSEWEEPCQRLSQFYLTTRYVDALPGGVMDEISDEDARTSLAAAANIVTSVRGRVTGQA
jgi:HEPN domain-containing protein